MSDVEINAAGITELLNQPDALALLDEAAAKIANTAAAITRRGADQRRGHIADKYITEKAQPGPHGGEAAAGNTDWFFHLEEFGSAKQAPQRPLFRSILEAGYEAEALPK